MAHSPLLDGFLILDRDGVINEDFGYVHLAQDLVYKHGAIAGIQKFRAAGTEIIIVTNQAGIAKGFFTYSDYEVLTKQICHDIGVSSSSVLMCPHHPDGSIKEYTKTCNCRKPQTGLVDHYCKEKLKRSIMIGDKISDAQFARIIGADFYLMSDSRYVNSEDMKDFKTISSILQLYEIISNE